MKKPTPTPPANVPPEAASDDQLMDFIVRNKGILIVSIIIIVLIFAIAFFYTSYSSEQEMEAWVRLNDSLQKEAPTRSLEDVINQIDGTSAEPWALYLLSIQHFKDGNIKQAKATFDRLAQGHPDHYLLSNPLLAPSFREKLLAELDWRERHPIPVSPPLSGGGGIQMSDSSEPPDLGKGTGE